MEMVVILEIIIHIITGEIIIIIIIVIIIIIIITTMVDIIDILIIIIEKLKEEEIMIEKNMKLLKYLMVSLNSMRSKMNKKLKIKKKKFIKNHL